MSNKSNRTVLIIAVGAAAISGYILGERVGEKVMKLKTTMLIEDLYHDGGYIMAPNSWCEKHNVHI